MKKQQIQDDEDRRSKHSKGKSRDNVDISGDRKEEVEKVNGGEAEDKKLEDERAKDVASGFGGGRSEVEELEENWKRALADYQNLQKRVEKEKRQVIQFANSVLIMRLLPILDNLETMRKHSDEQGLEMIVNEFEKVLREEGLEEIDVVGKDFDASLMGAIESVSGEDGVVVEVTKKGYMYKNKILRPAEVKVGNGKDN